MNIKNRQEDADTEVTVTRQTRFLNFFQMSDHSIGGTNQNGRIIWKDTFRITEKGKNKNPGSSQNYGWAKPNEMMGACQDKRCDDTRYQDQAGY
ncbi:MAG: hypothetical protein ACKO23_03185 [Gemmataceae bacterium]